MKKIAVGDLGEFWYGDYKEPFVQLEGAVPGHPQGVVLKADDGKLLCAYCGKTYNNLGRHVHQHGMNAVEYKREVGLLQKSALVSERDRQMRIANALRAISTGTFVPYAKTINQMNGSKKGVPRPEIRGRGNPHYNPEHLNKTGRCYTQVLEVARSIHRSGKQITRQRMSQRGIGDRLIQAYFGSFDALRIEVGATSMGWKRWTDAALLAALRNLARHLGRTPAISDLRRFGVPSQPTFRRHFGSYVEACSMAGLDPNLPFPDGTSLDVAVLTAYATVPNIKEVTRMVGVGNERVMAVLVRFGFPFNPYNSRQSEQRRQWAGDMARRLATPFTDVSESSTAA